MMKILLIEDEPDLGSIIQKSLSHHQYVVDWAMDGKAGWEYLTVERDMYSLAIIDWMLPKISGVELCQRLRAEKHSLPILMLTARDRMEDKITGLDAGADDYLVKPFGMEELLARLRALHRRAPTFQAERLQVGNLRLDYGNNAVTIISSAAIEQSVTLTAKEFQLLEYLMQHPDLTLTHEQIRNRIWAFDSESASNVVAAQIRLLRKKLAEFDRDDAIETIRGFGYRLNAANLYSKSSSSLLPFTLHPTVQNLVWENVTGVLVTPSGPFPCIHKSVGDDAQIATPPQPSP